MSCGVRTSVLCALALALLVACGGGLSSAKSSFKKGDYADAKTTLVSMEVDAKTWPASRRAEYALYRGLTHHALGDRAEATTWLREAKTLAADPAVLSADDRTRLDLALESLSPDAAPPSP
jgi:hypothetical protein